jgi:hypothetical protein
VLPDDLISSGEVSQQLLLARRQKNEKTVDVLFKGTHSYGSGKTAAYVAAVRKYYGEGLFF